MLLFRSHKSITLPAEKKGWKLGDGGDREKEQLHSNASAAPVSTNSTKHKTAFAEMRENGALPKVPGKALVLFHGSAGDGQEVLAVS